MMRKKAAVTSSVEVRLNLRTNWGHGDWIGLTEVQFFDRQQVKLDVDKADILVAGARISGDVSALCNGKSKTIKERNMWTCSRPTAEPVVLTFVIRRPTSYPPDQEFGLSKIRLWNYNKSIHDLSVGVSDLQIEVDGVSIFVGRLDRGCGNQVFNYAKDILVPGGGLSLDDGGTRQRSAPPEIKRSQTDNVTRNSSANLVSANKLDNVSIFSTDTDLLGGFPSARSELGIHESRSDSLLSAKVTDPTESSGEPRSRRRKQKDRDHRPKMAARLDGSQCSSVESSLTTPGASLETSRSQALPSENGTTPAPDGDAGRLSAVPSHVSADLRAAVSPKPSSPYLSDEDNRSMLDQLRKITKDNRKGEKKDLPSWLHKHNPPELLVPPDDRARGTKVDDLLDNWPTAGVPHLPTVLDDINDLKINNPETKTLSVQEESGRLTPSRMKDIEHKRAEWKKKEQVKLEESWTSLNLFNRSQKGRISLDLQKDVLDEYLLQDKIKMSQPTIVEEPDIDLDLTDVESDLNVSEESFVIPELPMGQEMVINILTTWGDHHYVGLNGIEIFTSTGELATVSKIIADPEDINVLPEYKKDPRVVGNLIDGVNRTRDDTHMWLAPYTRGREHLLKISFPSTIQIAMMRIWNYNKSRIHADRGAKDIEITLNGQKIFEGEITRACGGIVGGCEAFGETILFTMEEDILEQVAQHDKAFEADFVCEDDEEEEVERPLTADGEDGDVVKRPFTSAAHRVTTTTDEEEEDGNLSVPRGQRLNLNFTATWGDPYYIGLTGLEVVSRDGDVIPLTLEMLDADPRDLHILPGYEGDDRTLDKLIDGTNITTSDEHMWLVPFTDGEDHLLRINLQTQTDVAGLRFWNYNKSPEDTYRGARTVHVMLDGRQVSPQPDGFLIRKGPGNCFFDFAQDVDFLEPQTPRPVDKKPLARPSDSLILEKPSQEYEVFQKPCGFIYQLQLLSTWGDLYYVGLNGFEFYDSQGDLIKLEPNNVSAYPDSVNVLDGVENDVRTPDKLIDGQYDTTDGRHMWLAPVLPNLLNRIYVIFDAPVEISMIKIWNYSKTGNRGVKDFALLVDDLLVYNGLLEMVVPAARGILPTCPAPQRPHTVMFSSDVTSAAATRAPPPTLPDQDVQLMNDRKVVAKHSAATATPTNKVVDQTQRPKTSVPAQRGKVLHRR